MTYEMIEVEQELSEHELQQLRTRMLVDRLRTTEHEQCIGLLRAACNEYCGVGEACDLFREETGEGEWEYRKDDAIHYYFSVSGEGAVGSMPSTVADWYGLPHEPYVETTNVTVPGLLDRNHEAVCLTSCNDHGMTFDQLADLIQHFFVERA